MSRLALALLVLPLAALACASPEGHRSVTPRVEVVVKDHHRRPAAADYRVAPDEARLVGSGGSGR